MDVMDLSLSLSLSSLIFVSLLYNGDGKEHLVSGRKMNIETVSSFPSSLLAHHLSLREREENHLSMGDGEVVDEDSEEERTGFGRNTNNKSVVCLDSTNFPAFLVLSPSHC